MGLPSFPVVLPLSLAGILLFLVTGFLKNLEERRRFDEFLESQRRDPEVQKKIRNARAEPGNKTGHPNVRARYRDRNTGVNWTGASVHGAVPQRKPRRKFLRGNLD